MWFWCILCFVIAYGGLTGGGISLTIVFGGIGCYLLYCILNADKIEEYQRKKREQEEINKATQRFHGSGFVSGVINMLRNTNWRDLDTGVKIYKDRIEMSGKTYRFENYGLAKLDESSCKQLAIYIKAESNLENVVVVSLTSFSGGSSNSYSGFVTSSGQVHISSDADYTERVIGYQVYRRKPQPVKPKGQAW